MRPELLRKSSTLPALISLVLLLTMSTAIAEVPQVVNYQGRLTDPSGDPVSDGDYQITFTIYTKLTSGFELWSSGPQTVTVNDGFFSYPLGSVVPIPDSVFSTGDQYLGITVDTDPEISPRTPFTSSAFSLVTKTIVDDAITSGKILDGSVNRFDIGEGQVHSSHISDGTILSEDIHHDAVASIDILDGTIQFVDIDQNSAVEGDVMKWNGSAWTTSPTGNCLSFLEDTTYVELPYTHGDGEVTLKTITIPAGTITGGYFSVAFVLWIEQYGGQFIIKLRVNGEEFYSRQPLTSTNVLIMPTVRFLRIYDMVWGYTTEYTSTNVDDLKRMTIDTSSPLSITLTAWSSGSEATLNCGTVLVKFTD